MEAVSSDKVPVSVIIKKILEGEKALFATIITGANSLLYKTGRAYGFNHEDTQDLMQDTFVDAYFNLSGFRNESAINTWLVKIMLNKCYHKMKKFSYQKEVSEVYIHEKSIPMFTNNQENDLSHAIRNREIGRIIENSLSKIPLDYRMVFMLREINGFSTAETAEALNISEPNVKTRLSRTKVLLRKEIEKSYSAEDIFEFNLIYCGRMVERVMAEIEKLNARF